MSMTQTQKTQLKVQELAEEHMKTLEMMSSGAYLPIDTLIQRRAVAYMVRYLGVKVEDFRAHNVFAKKVGA